MSNLQYDLRLTENPQRVTIPNGSVTYTIDYDTLLDGDDNNGTILIDNISIPTRFKIGVYGETAHASTSGVYTTTDKPILPAPRGKQLLVRGASSVFQVTVFSE
jgi:hypothetical protein